MKHSNSIKIFTAGLSLLLLASGCRDKLVADTLDFTEYGWELWAELDYEGALVQFRDALDIAEDYPDTWNGLGWTFIELGNADSSVRKFDRGIILEDTTEVAVELLAGRAFSNLALGDFTAAVADAKNALTAEATWIFSRNTAITYEDLMITVATGFYGAADFDSSLVWVKLLDSNFDADVTTPAGRSELAAHINLLASGS